MTGRRPRWWPARMRGSVLMTSPSIAPALLEHLADGIIACDADGVTLTFNRKAREIFGAPREHLPAVECAEHYALYAPGEDRILEIPELPLAKALQGEQVRESLVEVRRPRHPRRLLSVSGGPVRSRHGRLLGAVIAIRDVTRAADEERTALARGLAADHVPVPVVVVRVADGSIAGVNAAANDVFGYGGEELVGRPRALLDAPIAGSPVQRAGELLEAIEQHGAWTGEIEHARKDGSLFWAAVTIAPYEHPAFGPVWISIHTEITDRKLADDSAERFRSLFEHNPVGILVMGADRRLVDVNQTLCAFTGYRRDELVGRTLAEIVDPEDAPRVADLSLRLLTGDIPHFRTENGFITKDGAAIQVVQLGAAVRAPGDRQVTGVIVVHPVAG